jgi:hypothetical protein
MSSADITKPRRRRLDEQHFGGADHARNAYSVHLAQALTRWGKKPGNRLEDFHCDAPSGKVDAFDIMTSFPMLSMGLRATGSDLGGELWYQMNPDERTEELHALSMDIDDEARELRSELRQQSFAPKEPRLVEIPKIKVLDKIPIDDLFGMDPEAVIDPSCRGKTRTLTVADRRQRAIGKVGVNVLNAVMQHRWPTSVVGCRPGIGIGDIIKGVQAAVTSTRRTVVLAIDIKAFFDSVPIANVLDLARERIGYRADSKLGWLIEHAILGRGCFVQRNALPQGNPLSPLLANLYAAEVIDTVASQWGPTLRYVDDVFVLCRDKSHARMALAAIEKAAGPQGLSIAAQKTQIVDLRSGPRALTYLGLDLNVDAVGTLHYRLRDASVVKLWYGLCGAVEGRSTTNTAAEHVMLQVIRRHQIWLGWIYAFGAAEWTPEQVHGVQRIIDAFPCGGDGLGDIFAEAWRLSYGGTIAERTEIAKRFARVFAENGIVAKLDHDGILTIPAPDIAEMRAKATEVYASRKALPLRWFVHHADAVSPRWTAPPISIRAPSLRARINTNDFGDAYTDALPGLPGEIAVTLGRKAKGDGVLPGVIAM